MMPRADVNFWRHREHFRQLPTPTTLSLNLPLHSTHTYHTAHALFPAYAQPLSLSRSTLQHPAPPPLHTQLAHALPGVCSQHLSLSLTLTQLSVSAVCTALAHHSTHTATRSSHLSPAYDESQHLSPSTLQHSCREVRPILQLIKTRPQNPNCLLQSSRAREPAKARNRLLQPRLHAQLLRSRRVERAHHLPRAVSTFSESCSLRTWPFRTASRKVSRACHPPRARRSATTPWTRRASRCRRRSCVPCPNYSSISSREGLLVRELTATSDRPCVFAYRT